MDHLIRVDRVHSLGVSTATSKKADWLGGADPKLSIFVGGLDYETKEDELRTFFEQLVAKERGEREKKYVTGVRVVRDKDTQLGKGFGYVHFAVSRSVCLVRCPGRSTDPRAGTRKRGRDDGD